jgi:hypothetical protein
MTHGWFTEGFDTKNRQEAKALIETLRHYCCSSLSSFPYQLRQHLLIRIARNAFLRHDRCD